MTLSLTLVPSVLILTSYLMPNHCHQDPIRSLTYNSCVIHCKYPFNSWPDLGPEARLCYINPPLTITKDQVSSTDITPRIIIPPASAHRNDLLVVDTISQQNDAIVRIEQSSHLWQSLFVIVAHPFPLQSKDTSRMPQSFPDFGMDL